MCEIINVTGIEDCPFCGGRAALYKSQIYANEAVYIKCESCSIGTTPIAYNALYMQYKQKEHVILSQEEAIADTIFSWNMRVKEKAPAGRPSKQSATTKI